MFSLPPSGFTQDSDEQVWDDWIPLILFGSYDTTLMEDQPYAKVDHEREKVDPRWGGNINRFPEVYQHKLNVLNSDMRLNNWRVTYYPESEALRTPTPTPVGLHPGFDRASLIPPPPQPTELNPDETAQPTEDNPTTPPHLVSSIHFPTFKERVIAKIAPPFEIQEYNIAGELTSTYNGVLPNVGEVFQWRIILAGVNMNHRVGLRVKDERGNVYEYDMGVFRSPNIQTDANGNPVYGRLIWANGDMIRFLWKDASIHPVYPYEQPYLKFDSIVVYGPYRQRATDIYLYIHSIDARYRLDEIYDQRQPDDIEDNDYWKEEVFVDFNEEGDWIFTVPINEYQVVKFYSDPVNLPSWLYDDVLNYRPSKLSLEAFPGVLKHFIIRKQAQHHIYQYYEDRYYSRTATQRFDRGY